MIPGAFAYHRPTSVKEAVGLLAQFGDDGRALAGGHSLIPMMKLRLATPANLIDLAGIAELKGVRTDGNDIVIGAMTTQHELLGSDVLGAKLPILGETSAQVADPQVRYLGTLGGNVANGDPGNDMPAVMMCLNATYHVMGKNGERRIAARQFYQGAYFTALEPGDVLTAVRIPVPAGRTRLRLRKTQAQDRRLRDCGRRRRAHHERRQSRHLLDRSHQRCRDAAVGGRSGKILIGSTLDAATVKKAVAAAEAITAPADRRPRTGAIPHQNGGRDAHARACPRQIARPRLTGRTQSHGQIPSLHESERQDH